MEKVEYCPNFQFKKFKPFLMITMGTRLLKLKHKYNMYYIGFFGSDTIQDLKNVLSKKYNFINDNTLNIYENNVKLHKNYKIADIQDKIILKIVGQIAPKEEPEVKPKKEEKKSNIDFFPMFNIMGFDESRETINQLMEDNNDNDNKFAAAISTLLLKKKPKKAA